MRRTAEGVASRLEHPHSDVHLDRGESVFPCVAERAGDMRNAHPANYFSACLKASVPEVYSRQITADLTRTFPSEDLFAVVSSRGCVALREILHAYAVHDPMTGYCQGMNFAAGAIVMHEEEEGGGTESSFWLFVALMERTRALFTADMPAVSSSCAAIEGLLFAEVPAVHSVLRKEDIAADMYAVPWLCSLLLAEGKTMRDGFLHIILESTRIFNVLVSVVVAMIHEAEDRLLACQSTIEGDQAIMVELRVVPNHVEVAAVFKRASEYDFFCEALHRLEVDGQMREHATLPPRQLRTTDALDSSDDDDDTEGSDGPPGGPIFAVCLLTHGGALGAKLDAFVPTLARINRRFPSRKARSPFAAHAFSLPHAWRDLAAAAWTGEASSYFVVSSPDPYAPALCGIAVSCSGGLSTHQSVVVLCTLPFFGWVRGRVASLLGHLSGAEDGRDVTRSVFDDLTSNLHPPYLPMHVFSDVSAVRSIRTLRQSTLVLFKLLFLHRRVLLYSRSAYKAADTLLGVISLLPQYLAGFLATSEAHPRRKLFPLYTFHHRCKLYLNVPVEQVPLLREGDGVHEAMGYLASTGDPAVARSGLSNAEIVVDVDTGDVLIPRGEDELVQACSLCDGDQSFARGILGMLPSPDEDDSDWDAYELDCVVRDRFEQYTRELLQAAERAGNPAQGEREVCDAWLSLWKQTECYSMWHLRRHG